MRNRLSTMPVVAPARAPIAAPAGATPGTPVATSGGAANGLLPNAEATGGGADGAAADQLGGTDKGPMRRGLAEAWPTSMSRRRRVRSGRRCHACPSRGLPPCLAARTRPALRFPRRRRAPKKLALVTVWAICAGLKVPVDDKVFQTFAFGPQVAPEAVELRIPGGATAQEAKPPARKVMTQTTAWRWPATPVLAASWAP